MKEDMTGRKFDEWMSTMFPDGSGYGRITLPLLALWDGMERNTFLGTLGVFSLMNFAAAIYQRQHDYKIVHEEEEDGLTRGKLVRRSPDDPPKFRLVCPEVLPDGFDKENPEHRAIGAAMAKTDFKGGDIEYFYDVYHQAGVFLRENDLEEGQPNFDVPFELLNPQRNRDLRLEDFKVLFAVNSCIGEKGYRRVTAEMIALRTAGVKNVWMTPAWMGEPLTERQVRYSLEKLQRKGFFHRVLVANKFTFICKPESLDMDELIAVAKNWKRKHKSKGKATRV